MLLLRILTPRISPLTLTLGDLKQEQDKKAAELLLLQEKKKQEALSQKDTGKDEDSKYGPGSKEYENRFDPMKVGGRAPASASQGLGSASDSQEEEYGVVEVDDEDKSKDFNADRDLASFNQEDSLDWEGYSSSSGGFRGFFSRYRGARGRGEKSVQAALKALRKPVPTVQSVFNVHGSEVNLLVRQKDLVEEFCKSHACNGLGEE